MDLEDGVSVPYEKRSQLQSHRRYDKYSNTNCDRVAFAVKILVKVLQNKTAWFRALRQ